MVWAALDRREIGAGISRCPLDLGSLTGSAGGVETLDGRFGWESTPETLAVAERVHGRGQAGHGSNGESDESTDKHVGWRVDEWGFSSEDCSYISSRMLFAPLFDMFVPDVY